MSTIFVFPDLYINGSAQCSDLTVSSDTINRIIKSNIVDTKTRLVLEGGGVSAIVYCSILKIWHLAGVLGGIRSAAGSSSGALASALLSVGASPDYITRAILTLDIGGIIRPTGPIRCLDGTAAAGVLSAVRNLGWSTGDRLLTSIRGYIGDLTGNPDITLGEVGEKYRFDLTIITMLLKTRTRVELSARTHPRLSLALAVRMSMSIPILIAPVELDGNLYVDGGVIDNYPIRTYHTTEGTADRLQLGVIGVLLQTRDEYRGSYNEINSIVDLGLAIIDTYRTHQQLQYLDPADRAVTIRCETSVGSMNFNLTAGQKRTLLQDGIIAMERYYQSIEKNIDDMLRDMENISDGIDGTTQDPQLLSSGFSFGSAIDFPATDPKGKAPATI